MTDKPVPFPAPKDRKPKDTAKLRAPYKLEGEYIVDDSGGIMLTISGNIGKKYLIENIYGPNLQGIKGLADKAGIVLPFEIPGDEE